VSAELTTIETRLVERYVWMLDLVSRCAQGLDHGDWYYLADKAGDLAYRAERLAEVAGEIAQAVRDGRPGHPPRPGGARRRRRPRAPLPRRAAAPPRRRPARGSLP
jgi:hypothetical protein